MRYWPLLVYVLLNTACAKDNDGVVSDYVACTGDISPGQFDFGAPYGTKKAARYHCYDIKGKACVYIRALDDSTSVTDCEGPIVTDGRG